MKEQVLHLFQDQPQAALLFSIAISVLVALAGIIPSFFITAANILFFGFWEGTAISFLGEALGAMAAFVLYRKGIKKQALPHLQRFPKVQRLVSADNKEAMQLIFLLRLIPFVPSGLITFAAAIGRVSAAAFFAASSLGKMPALVLEAYSVYQVTQFNRIGKVILTGAALLLLIQIVRHSVRRNKKAE